MTLMTLILASVVMVAVGLKGNSGMLAALLMGGVVCTALSMAGSFITDLKIGYWLGTTPRKQETWKFLGTIISAATVAGVMIVLDKTYGFNSGKLAAPQANAMAAVIKPLMSGQGAPWALYGIGALLALVLDRCKIPALAFSLGMFIPIQLNIPLFVGGAVHWFVTTRTKDEQLNKLRSEKRNAHCFWFHCWWRTDGCRFCIAKVLRHRLRLLKLVAKPSIGNVITCCLHCVDILFYRCNANKERRN